jgi:hypothetical protein
MGVMSTLAAPTLNVPVLVAGLGTGMTPEIEAQLDETMIQKTIASWKRRRLNLYPPTLHLQIWWNPDIMVYLKGQ